jgi:O-antigen ligase
MYLKLTNKKLRPIFYGILLIAGAYFIGDRFAFALNTGMKRSVVFFFMLSVFLIIPYLYSKMGINILAKGLFFLFWLPVPIVLSRYAPFSDLYIYEFGVWALLGFIFINAAISNDPRLQKTIKRFPFLPFLICIGGALTTYLLTNSSLYDFACIRFTCILPLLICFLACYTITTVEDAEKLLWIILTSAGILGIMMLLGEKIFGFVQRTEYAMDSGRLSAYIAIPFFGALKINPEIGAELFSFVGVISFCFWLNRYSFYARAHALIILIVSIAVIVWCQGRGAMISFACSIGAMTILSLLVAKRKKLLIILKMGTVVASTVSAYWLLAVHSLIDSFYKHGTILFTDPMNAPNLLGRIAIWQEAIEVIIQHPFGVGLHGFDLEPLSSSTWLAHNLYLWLILSFGIIGFIGFMWIIFTLFKIFWGGLKSDRSNLQMLSIGGIGALTIIVVNGMVSPLFDSPHAVAIIWSPIAVIMAAMMSQDVGDKRMIIDGKIKQDSNDEYHN